MSFLKALTLLFIGLQLTGQIDWSWWYVLCPLIAEGCIEATMKMAIAFTTWQSSTSDLTDKMKTRKSTSYTN